MYRSPIVDGSVPTDSQPERVPENIISEKKATYI